MDTLPMEIVRVLRPFEGVFSARVWEWAQVLLVGAILAPGQRTVTTALRVLGLGTEVYFQNYHRVLNRARWSSLALSRLVLLQLVRVFVPPDAPILVGLDDTIERRRGAKIAAKGIYRDPVRSSKRPGGTRLRQSERAALGVAAAVGVDPLGGAGVGAPLPDGARPVGTLRPDAGAAP